MAYEKHVAGAPEPSEPRPRSERRAHHGEGPEAPPFRAGSDSVDRSPQPKVLARIPQADSPGHRSDWPGSAPPSGEEHAEPAPSPKRDRLPGFDGRVINQRLATRVLIGGAVVLLLVALVPLAFRGGDSEQDTQTADSATESPGWTPENPAPDASAAPTWQADAKTSGPGPSDTSVPPDWSAESASQDDAAENQPSGDTSARSGPSGEKSSQPVVPPRTTTTDRTPSGGSSSSHRDSPAAVEVHSPAARGGEASANRHRALPAAHLPRTPMAERGGEPRSTGTDGHAPVGGYDGEYQAAQPHPAYRQAARPDHSTAGVRPPDSRYRWPAPPGRGDRQVAPGGPSSDPPDHTASRDDSKRGEPPAPSYDSGEYTPIRTQPRPQPDQQRQTPAARSGDAARYSDRDDARQHYRRDDRDPPQASRGYGGGGRYRAADSGFSGSPPRYESWPASSGDSPTNAGGAPEYAAGDRSDGVYRDRGSAGNGVAPTARFRGDIEQPAVNAARDDPEQGLY